MVFILPYLTRVIAGVSVPDTPIINASIAFARAELPDYGYNHVMRAWLNGQALINHLPESNRSEIDAEAFGVATILHDLGWLVQSSFTSSIDTDNTWRSNNTAIVSNDKTFEVDGAIAARNFLQQKGGSTWDKHRIQLVWDAIALHTNNEIYPHKEREVAYTAAGTATELFGPELATRMLVCIAIIGLTFSCRPTTSHLLTLLFRELL